MAITLNNDDFAFTTSHLPCIINGVDGSGASNFSIHLAAQLIQQGNKLVFFTAYPMAKDKLKSLVKNDLLAEVSSSRDIDYMDQDKTILVNSNDLELFHNVLQSIGVTNDYTVFVKNIESYDSLGSLVWKYSRLMLSGSIDDCGYADDAMKVNWKSKIMFSSSRNITQIDLPQLEKYEAYLESPDNTGILRLVY